METLKLIASVDAEGVLQVTVPRSFANQQVEIVLVLQPLTTTETPRDALGYPLDYFERMDAIVADDLIERPSQLSFEVRDEFE